MATAGMHNMNNAPPDPRPLTAAELDRVREAMRDYPGEPDDPPISRVTWAQLRACFNPSGIALMLAFAVTAALFGWGSVQLIKAALAGLP